MCSSDSPISLGIAGLGGYAHMITDLVLSAGEYTQPRMALRAVCDPAPAAHVTRVNELRLRGVSVFDDFERMLRSDVEAVWLPVPIHLHRPLVERALAAGKAVMVEKPAAGCIDDVDAMIAAQRRAEAPVAVGFQDVFDPETLTLKRRLLRGDIGRVTGATLTACAPRGARYFARNAWAGRLRVGGAWVLDSPANNALAHPLNLALFLLGAKPHVSAEPVALQAETYRAAQIESYDTLSARVTLASGVGLLILLTHACAAEHPARLVIRGEDGLVTWWAAEIVVQTRHGSEIIERVPRRDHMLARFARLVREQDDLTRAVATLDVARAHSLVVSGIAQAAPIHDAPEPFVRTLESPAGTSRVIVDVERAMLEAASAGRMLHESGLLRFTREPGRLDLHGYSHFRSPAAATEPRATLIHSPTTPARDA